MCCKELKESLGGDDTCYSTSNVAKEKGRQLRLNLTPGKTLCKAQIDGCLIKDSGIIKCDFLFKICPDNKYYLVELKGTDVEHAVKQIENTFDIVNKRIKEKPQHFTGHIISSAIPRAELRFQNLKE